MPYSEFELSLTKEMTEYLKGLGLSISKHCIFVSIDQQKLYYFGSEDVFSYTVSTARAGRGCVLDSLQTPEGLHRICEKIGAKAPAGMIFKHRQPTGKLAFDDPTLFDENLITSRILRLEGLEAGRNQGYDATGRLVDTRQRFIYIHGTNQGLKLGQPNSHGCVLLSDEDIIQLFEMVEEGTHVLIR